MGPAARRPALSARCAVVRRGTAALPETGGAATFVRRAFNDQLGFLTGWVLLLDYVIVIALAAFFVPHYLGHAVGWDWLTDSPGDFVVGVAVIDRRSDSIRPPACALPARDCDRGRDDRLPAAPRRARAATARLTGQSGKGTDLGTLTWSAIAFALPAAMLAFTGLGRVANLAAETREPGEPCRGASSWGSASRGDLVPDRDRGDLRVPRPSRSRRAGRVRHRPRNRVAAGALVGVAAAFSGELPAAIVDALRIFVGLTGTLILVAVVTTSFSGAGRLAYSLGRYDMLPRAFGRLSRRTLISPASIVATAVIAVGVLLIAGAAGEPVRFLASLYSFGILIAFTAAQVAVVRHASPSRTSRVRTGFPVTCTSAALLCPSPLWWGRR